MRKLRFFFSKWQNWIGLILCLIFVVTAVAAPTLSPMDPKDPGPFKRVGRASDFAPHAPSSQALLGTTTTQFDVFHTLVWGARDALLFGSLVVAISLIFGVLFGSFAGYSGGLVNSAMMRVADSFLSFPILAGVVFIQQLMAASLDALSSPFAAMDWLARRGPMLGVNLLTEFFSKIDPLMVCLILFSWMTYARLANTRVITLKDDDFVQASRALGGGHLWVLGKHLIPNSIGPALVVASRDMGNVVILQATITFLKLGGNSPWGNLLSAGRDWVIGPGGSVFKYWWVYVPATLAVILFGISWNLIGDGINEVMNPTATTVKIEA